MYMHMLDMVGSPLSPIPLPADSSLGSPGFCQRESRPGTPLGSSRGPPSGPHWIRVAHTQWAVGTGVVVCVDSWAWRWMSVYVYMYMYPNGGCLLGVLYQECHAVLTMS